MKNEKKSEICLVDAIDIFSLLKELNLFTGENMETPVVYCKLKKISKTPLIFFSKSDIFLLNTYIYTSRVEIAKFCLK